MNSENPNPPHIQASKTIDPRYQRQLLASRLLYCAVLPPFLLAGRAITAAPSACANSSASFQSPFTASAALRQPFADPTAGRTHGNSSTRQQAASQEPVSAPLQRSPAAVSSSPPASADVTGAMHSRGERRGEAEPSRGEAEEEPSRVAEPSSRVAVSSWPPLIRRPPPPVMCVSLM